MLRMLRVILSYYNIFLITILFFCFVGVVTIFADELPKKNLSNINSISKQKILVMQYGVKKARTPQKYSNSKPIYENLLDQIDVYSLSPYAKKIALHRMIPQHVIEKVVRGEMSLPSDWSEIVKVVSRRHNLDPALIAAVIQVESGFFKEALSPKGAKGLMQLMPETGLELGVTDLFDPMTNVDAGSRYLRQQLDRFGSVELALAAYNAGPGAVMKYGGIPPYKETQAFVKKVLSAL